MRKALITMASVAALATPLLAFGANAGAAAATPTCKTASGTATFSPALPPVTSTATVKSTITSTGKATGCTGGGVTSATMTGKLKFSKAGNCSTLIKGTGGPTSGSITLKWNTGTTSTIGSATLKQVSGKPTQASISGKITAGTFVGKTATQTVNFAPKTGNCTTIALSVVSYTQATPLVIK